MTGANSELPPAKELQSTAIQSSDSGEEIPGNGSAQEQSAAEQIDLLLSKLGTGNNPQPPTPLIPIGSGLPALPKKMLVKIVANAYNDFTELPPPRGKGRPVPQSLEGQIIMVQAAELLQARNIIPDLATWIQCYSLYAATMATTLPATARSD